MNHKKTDSNQEDSTGCLKQRKLLSSLDPAELKAVIAHLPEMVLQAQLEKGISPQETAAENTSNQEEGQTVELAAKANEALQETLNELATESAPEALVHFILKKLEHVFGAVNASLFLYDNQEHTLTMSASVCRGRIINIAADERFALWHKPVPADLNEGWESLLALGYLPLSVNPPDKQAWPESIPWHRKMGHEFFFCIPLSVGSKPLGFVGVAFDRKLDLTAESIELAKALSNQLSLSIELKRLSDEAQQLAVEQERAKTAYFSEVNDLIQENLLQLSGDFDFDSFVELALQKCASKLNAVETVFFEHNNTTGALWMRNAMRKGKVVDIQTDPLYELWRQPILNDVDVSNIIFGEEIIVDLADNMASAGLWPPSIPWHRKMGHTCIYLIPLGSSEKLVGFLGLAFDNLTQVEQEKREFARSLGHQVNLALQLARFADDQKEEVLINERTRMSREIHDTLAQSFTGILKQVEAAELIAQEKKTKLNELLGRVRYFAQYGLEEARRSVLALRPSLLEQNTLEAAVGILTSRARDNYDLKTQYHSLIPPKISLAPKVELELLRVAEESINNVVKHSKANLLSVKMGLKEEALFLEIKDNGIGFDSKQHRKGVGLDDMPQRIKSVQGQFELTSEPGKGTQISALVPALQKQ